MIRWISWSSIYKQGIKNVLKNVGMACQKYANIVGIMHKSKGQRIGKALSLHLFHTTVRWCMKAT